MEDYAMDGGEDWDEEEEQPDASTAMPKIKGSTTSSKSGDSAAGYRAGVSTISSSLVIDPIAATAERPRILDDC